MGVESIPIDSPNEAKLPRPLLMVAAVLGTLALVPPVMIAKARTTTSTTPRLSIISDMDYQPKFKAQTTNSLFADGRSMRPQVSGTVARGDLREDDAYYRGILSEAEAEAEAESGGVEQAGASGLRLIPVDADDELLPNYTTEFPLPVDEALIRRGKERYEIYCATCHGQGGDGDGRVTLRALELEHGGSPLRCMRNSFVSNPSVSCTTQSRTVFARCRVMPAKFLCETAGPSWPT